MRGAVLSVSGGCNPCAEVDCHTNDFTCHVLSVVVACLAGATASDLRLFFVCRQAIAVILFEFDIWPHQCSYISIVEFRLDLAIYAMLFVLT